MDSMKGNDMSNTVTIKSLEAMEEIVANDPLLEWDGWDVVSYSAKRTSFLNPKARKFNGEWRQANRYPIESDGWTLPGVIG